MLLRSFCLPSYVRSGLSYRGFVPSRTIRGVVPSHRLLLLLPILSGRGGARRGGINACWRKRIH
nr:hypothetical protein ABT39_MTgene243 [Picea glauca]